MGHLKTQPTLQMGPVLILDDRVPNMQHFVGGRSDGGGVVFPVLGSFGSNCNSSPALTTRL